LAVYANLSVTPKQYPHRYFGFENPRAIDAIDRFVECTDYKFECSEIVGRRFESIGDHAEYISNEGCLKTIEVLAAA
jgi:hypothetical protein